MAKKILVTLGVTEKQKEQITAAAQKQGYSVAFSTDNAEAEALAVDSEIQFGKLVGAVKAAKELKWLCASSAGVNMFLGAGTMPEDCLLTNSSGAYGVTLSEHLIMTTLMIMRSYKRYEAIMETTNWTHDIRMDSIMGSRITILGTGDIGTNYAIRAKAFGPAKIVGINRSGNRRHEIYDEVAKMEELDRYLPETDVLVMCLPGTPETDNVLTKERIALLPDSAYVINIGRGNNIDEAALIEALENDKLAGAALDVMRHEPMPENDPLRTTKNILLTPHSAGQMTLAYTKQRAVDMFLEDLENYCAGKPLAHTASKKLGY